MCWGDRRRALQSRTPRSPMQSETQTRKRWDRRRHRIVGRTDGGSGDGGDPAGAHHPAFPHTPAATRNSSPTCSLVATPAARIAPISGPVRYISAIVAHPSPRQRSPRQTPRLRLRRLRLSPRPRRRPPAASQRTTSRQRRPRNPQRRPRQWSPSPSPPDGKAASGAGCTPHRPRHRQCCPRRSSLRRPRQREPRLARIGSTAGAHLRTPRTSLTHWVRITPGRFPRRGRSPTCPAQTEVFRSAFNPIPAARVA